MEDDVAWYKVRAPLLVVRRCPIAEAEEIHELVQEQRVQAQSWTAGWLRLTDVEMWISSCSKQEGFIPLEDAGMPAVLQLSGNECPGGDWDQWAGLLHWWPLGGSSTSAPCHVWRCLPLPLDPGSTDQGGMDSAGRRIAAGRPSRHEGEMIQWDGVATVA
ncbi:unnamed protein product [Durusdinium trenchii]|uniref:Uncharacterized protein n=1 Tax=Durusdinium trenchii TaxID=1381693 RepID=A0ABP0M7K4_9DINO